VTAFWHPLSAVYLDQPKVLASPALLRLVLAGEGRAEVVYAGDRMWPAIRHGQTLVVSPLGGTPPVDGDVVLAVEAGIPDVMRLAGDAEAPAVAADADPGPSHPVTSGDLLGMIAQAPRRRGVTPLLTRAWLDCLEAARAEALRRGSSANFAAADLRVHDEGDGSLDAVLFTYDVYSFVPSPRDRVSLLRRLSRWLRPGGVVFLSARLTRDPWDRAVLSLQWLGRAARGRPGAWGDSHTRWLDATGQLRRSFVHVFTERRLHRETRAAGLRRVSWQGGHGLFVTEESAMRERSV
jgi:hypothetical protein